MSVVIKKITLQNYKLFAYKEIVFTNYLSVFDGPNGYGKTSVFDAIELSAKYSMVDLDVAPDWVGKSLRELNLRATKKINRLFCSY